VAELAVDVRRFSREEYERLAAEGFFRPEERLELIEGTIYGMSPQSSRHAAVLAAVQQALQTLLPPDTHLRLQAPLALGDLSEPEPDVAVVPGSWRDYLNAHPTTAALVIEVADSSLRHDRERKGRLYARSGIQEFWIVNLAAGRLEVFRDPDGEQFRGRLLLGKGETVTPLCAPGAGIAISDLLP